MKQLFAMAGITVILLSLPACGGMHRRNGHYTDRSREVFDCPVEAYYAGWIEDAIQLLSEPTEQKLHLAALYWELGENSKAADLLEKLLRDPRLTVAEQDELYLELFITRVLMGGYAQAAALRDNIEPALQRMDDRQRARVYFYNAWVYHEMGDLAGAEEFYRRSLNLYRWRAVAQYRLGAILRDINPAEAEALFQAAWNQDRAFTPALFPMAQLLAARGEWERARDILTIANARLPDDSEINSALAEASRHASAPIDGIQLIRHLITAVPPRVTPAPITPGEGIMRIGLSENRQLVSVMAGGGFDIRSIATGQTLYSSNTGEQFWVEWRGNGSFVIFDVNNRGLLNSSVPVIFELRSNQYTSIVAGAVPGANRTLRGNLEFRPGANGITVVNIVNMGDYLLGVVPAELPASWPMEALKAQAIIARSYAIAYRGRFADRGFDIWGDARSQAYGGVGGEHPRSTAAVNATRGMIL
ncbi:MAG: SpoIID/LytB domain-containing protein, partial [Treponema sp.]|nr:SpoIID/LytB domain-containing protein [Treponema sp.]